MKNCEGCQHCDIEPMDQIQPARHSAQINPEYKTILVEWCMYYDKPCEEVSECLLREE